MPLTIIGEVHPNPLHYGSQSYWTTSALCSNGVAPIQFIRKLRKGVFTDPDYRQEIDGHIWYGSFPTWTLDQIAWLKTEELRKAEPVREWKEPPPAFVYDQSADLEKRHLAELELAKLIPDKLEDIACDDDDPAARTNAVHLLMLID